MKTKKWLCLLLATALTTAACLAIAGCGEEEGDKNLPTANYKLPTDVAFGSSVAVHDPSAFFDEISRRYYAFGSHFAVASSTNLLTWKQEVSDGGANALYGTTNWRSVLSKSDALVGGTQNTWAPDVIYLNDTYYMYYSLTSNFGSSKSVIGRVSSDSVLGPYSNEEIIIYSTGGSGEPNCIDPELFYDKDGNLWMVYGSFFGGIYVKELDENGLPVDDGFGTMVWRLGASAGVEGPFIFYNEDTEYYYLMVSEGDLSTVYNMRVARSKNPNGPYVDITGNDVATTEGKGNKLAGNFQFAGDSIKAALGHNSVIVEDGKYFVVCHVRNNVNGGHHLEVHQLFFNEDYWPVLSPSRFADEKKGLVTQEQAAGVYDVVVHSVETIEDIIPSAQYTFSADGTIANASGTSAGTWSMVQDYYVTLTLNGIEYKGVVVPGWRDYGTQEGILCITATSETGNAIWARAADIS